MLPSKQVILEVGPSGQRRHYIDPVDVLSAWSPEQVPAVFDGMEQARRDGLYLAGYCAYELGYVLEPRLARLMPARRKTPLIQFGVFETYHVDKTAPDRAPAPLVQIDAFPRFAAYSHSFKTVLDYIAAGDVYQVNLSFPIEFDLQGDPLVLYDAMHARQPVNHGAVVFLGDVLLLSCSPELFFRIGANGQIVARPMKGTAARGMTPDEDQSICQALKDDEKSRAENLMIVDLLRNDLAKICTFGSVNVPALFSVETYPTLFQMTSTVTGTLAENLSFGALMTALFPCGSITGAPKIRAMEIIHELEDTPRNAYCGAIGHICPDRTMAFNVAIRTLSVYENGRACYNIGSGLVADSDPLSEYRECILKAEILLANAASA